MKKKSDIGLVKPRTVSLTPEVDDAMNRLIKETTTKMRKRISRSEVVDRILFHHLKRKGYLDN